MFHRGSTRRRVGFRRALGATVLGLLAASTGCDTGGSPPPMGSHYRPRDPESSTSSPGPEADRAQQGKPAGDAASSAIAGDRMKSFAPVVMSRQTESSPFRFAEIAKEAGIDFVHFSGMTDEKHFPTANGSGVAVFDYDGDGLLDLYYASATLLPLGTAEKGPNRLFKNLGNNRFKDVTEASGLGFRGF
ncbi:MAG: FG-GAP repeat domain-containing protein, partial [Isosphaeraceae bacterium]